jgi:aromatic-L-amino-acid decarboxylase
MRSAFSLVPDYLQTTDPSVVRNLMDTGIQLGRRFRALKLWMVMRHFGAAGLQARLSEHMRLARLFANWVDESPHFERLAPVPFSVVCFRAARKRDDEADATNEQILEIVNRSGEVFLSHTRLNGRFAIRLAIGNLHTTEEHVRRAWTLLNAALAEAPGLH